MFQLVGGIQALAAFIALAGDARAIGTLLALLTLVWVVVAKPRHDGAVISALPRSSSRDRNAGMVLRKIY